MKSYEKLRAEMRHLEKEIDEAKMHERADAITEVKEPYNWSNFTAWTLSMKRGSSTREDFA